MFDFILYEYILEYINYVDIIFQFEGFIYLLFLCFIILSYVKYYKVSSNNKQCWVGIYDLMINEFIYDCLKSYYKNRKRLSYQIENMDIYLFYCCG